jgi:hypothetical protein
MSSLINPEVLKRQEMEQRNHLQPMVFIPVNQITTTQSQNTLNPTLPVYVRSHMERRNSIVTMPSPAPVSQAGPTANPPNYHPPRRNSCFVAVPTNPGTYAQPNRPLFVQTVSQTPALTTPTFVQNITQQTPIIRGLLNPPSYQFQISNPAVQTQNNQVPQNQKYNLLITQVTPAQPQTIQNQTVRTTQQQQVPQNPQINNQNPQTSQVQPQTSNNHVQQQKKVPTPPPATKPAVEYITVAGYSCSECTETFNNKYAYNDHYRLKHEKRKTTPQVNNNNNNNSNTLSVPCLICDQNFTSPDEVRAHIQFVHLSLTAS